MNGNGRALWVALAVDTVALIVVGWLCAVGRLAPDAAGWLILGICGAGAAAARSRPGGPPPSGALTLLVLLLPMLSLVAPGPRRPA